MVRFGAALAISASLSACVAPPPAGYAYYGAPPQPQAVYAPPPSPSDYPPPADYGGEQLSYVEGVPYAVIGGEQLPLVFDGGLGWGFYDGYHRWHGAPSPWRGDLERRYPGGRGYSPPARGFGGRPESYAPPPGGPGGRPADGRFGEGRPAEGRPGEGRPTEGRPEAQHGGPPQQQLQRVNAPQQQRPAPPPPRPAPPPQRGGTSPACGQPGSPRC